MRLALSLLSCLAAAVPAVAQDSEPPRLSVELNRIDPLDGACRLTFLAENTLGTDLDGLALETVLIDRDGRVERLTLFDFGALPDGVPRVRQFDIPGLDCAGLGQVLVNGVADCSHAAGCDPLHLLSRTDVEVIG